MDLKPSQRRRLANLARHRAISKRIIAENTPKRPGIFLRFILLFLWLVGRGGVEYKQKAGRVVMAFASHVVVNGGGRHGTPHVVDENNFVK